MVKILWSGITGRTGREAVEIANTSGDFDIVAGICRSDSKYYNYEQLDEISEEFDVIVDFSHKDCFDKILNFALKVRKPIVIGTAGLSTEQMEAFSEASNIIPVFRGGNFRYNVKEFIDNVVEYARNSEKNSFELIETHYKTKKVPSETAKVVKKRVFDETGKNVEIKSLLEYDELINDWRVDDYHCRVVGFHELAEDVLKIADMMKDKGPLGVYDLDRLFLEMKLSAFLVEAKKQTYANVSVKKSLASRLGSHDYEYSTGNMTYHDTYFGGINFMGEEVVYCNGDIPIWGMNYYGVTLDENLSEEAVDKALRPALMQVGSDDIIPVRGPREYINGDYKYTFLCDGTLERFDGIETISNNSQEIYVLKCHGGLIKR